MSLLSLVVATPMLNGTPGNLYANPEHGLAILVVSRSNIIFFLHRVRVQKFTFSMKHGLKMPIQLATRICIVKVWIIQVIWVKDGKAVHFVPFIRSNCSVFT